MALFIVLFHDAEDFESTKNKTKGSSSQSVSAVELKNRSTGFLKLESAGETALSPVRSLEDDLIENSDGERETITNTECMRPELILQGEALRDFTTWVKMTGAQRVEQVGRHFYEEANDYHSLTESVLRTMSESGNAFASLTLARKIARRGKVAGEGKELEEAQAIPYTVHIQTLKSAALYFERATLDGGYTSALHDLAGVYAYIASLYPADDDMSPLPEHKESFMEAVNQSRKYYRMAMLAMPGVPDETWSPILLAMEEALPPAPEIEKAAEHELEQINSQRVQLGKAPLFQPVPASVLSSRLSGCSGIPGQYGVMPNWALARQPMFTPK